MAIFSSKKKLKPCYDNDPYLKVKKDWEKLKMELEEVVAERYCLKRKRFLPSKSCHKRVYLPYSGEFENTFIAFGRYKHCFCFVLQILSAILLK